jgi:hypothetical protein|tara:strand:- start:889 stop:1053 length:165 start_codon:yes stop_codon:yes gene_type:complete
MEEIIIKEINLLLNKNNVSNNFNSVIYNKIMKDEYLLKQIRGAIDFQIGEELNK